jgi:hypothetical protein
MLLSDLERNSNEPSVYGVIADFEGGCPPGGLKEVGFRAVIDKDGGLDATVLDAMILYGISGVKVMLEIPFGVAFESRTIVMTCTNIGADLSLLPPQNAESVAWDGYRAQLIAYASVWMEMKNCRNDILPITSYFQYLCGDAAGYQPEQMAREGYMVANFVGRLPIDQVDRTKAALMSVFSERFGGMEGIRTLVAAVGAEVQASMIVIRDDLEAKLPPFRRSLLRASRWFAKTLVARAFLSVRRALTV